MMKRTTNILFAAALAIVFSSGCFGQDPKLHLEGLSSLDAKARDVVEVNVDGKLLDLAKRVSSKLSDENAKKVSLAISGLKGIYVRVYNFEKDGEYDPADVDSIRRELNTPGWQRVANVRSRVHNQKVDVFTNFSGDIMNGMAVVISEDRSFALVNVVGSIDIETLAELSGKFNIPKIDVEKTH